MHLPRLNCLARRASTTNPDRSHETRRPTGRAKAATAVLVASGLLVAGCAKGTGDNSSDLADPSNAPGTNERVASLGLGDSDTLLALGVAPVAIAAWGQKGDVDASGVGPWAKDLLGDKKPSVIYDVARGFTPQVIEEVTKADPTKIIAVNQAVDKQAADSLNKIAPTTLKPEGTQDWQIPWQDQVKTIATAVDKKDKGEDLIGRTNKAFEEFRKNHPELQGKKAAVVMPYQGKLGLYTSGDGRGAFIESLGFDIPKELEGDGKTFYRDIAPENYDQLNSVDYLFVLDYQGAVDAVRKEPTFNNLDVVRQGKVRFLSEDTGNAMSMPNPVTIPWAIEQLKSSL